MALNTYGGSMFIALNGFMTFNAYNVFIALIASSAFMLFDAYNGLTFYTYNDFLVI